MRDRIGRNRNGGFARDPRHYLIDLVPTHGFDVTSPFGQVVWGELLGGSVWSTWAILAARLESGAFQLGDDPAALDALARLQRHDLAREVGPRHWEVRTRCPQPTPRSYDKAAAVAHYERFAEQARTRRGSDEGTGDVVLGRSPDGQADRRRGRFLGRARRRSAG